METQPIRDDRSDVRLEPTIHESGVHVHVDRVSPTFAPEPTESKRHEPGSAVADRYLLRGRIGRGHLGEIHEAVDLQLSAAGQKDHRVAIELVTLSRSQAGVRQRLTNEFVSLLSISHPNIARVMDFGVDGVTTFFTTELLEGVSLRSMLDDPTDPSTENELLSIVRSVGDGLSFLHAKGFVHGDLKPESIVVTTGYEVKIVDLASVRLARTRQGSTEVLFGGSVPVVQDDVFGLAGVAYEWLANEHPFGNMPDFEAFQAELSPRRVKGLPRYRWKALSRALELQPEARTPTIAEFMAEFGITGTETLVEAESKPAANRRGLVRPIFWMGAFAGLIALIQPNYEMLRELLVTLPRQVQDGFGLIASQAGDEESVSLPAIEPIDGEDPAHANLYPYSTEPIEADARGEMPAPGGETVNEPAIVPDLVQSNVEPVPTLRPVVVPSEPEPAVVHEQSGVASEPLPIQPALSSGDVSANSVPLSFEFAQDTITVSEGDNMVSIVVQRAGGLGREASMIWWTGDNTAGASSDYADLGASAEAFAPDQESLTVYVPLVSDSLVEQRESFNVYLSWESAPTGLVKTLEVVVIDDDS